MGAKSEGALKRPVWSFPARRVCQKAVKRGVGEGEEWQWLVASSRLLSTKLLVSEFGSVRSVGVWWAMLVKSVMVLTIAPLGISELSLSAKCQTGFARLAAWYTPLFSPL